MSQTYSYSALWKNKVVAAVWATQMSYDPKKINYSFILDPQVDPK